MDLLPLTIARAASRLAHGVLLPGLLVMGCCTASASTRYIAKYGSNSPNCGRSTSNPCLTVQYTISQSASGDQLVIGPGTFSENIVIDRNLTLVGMPYALSILDGGQAGTVVTVPSSVTATLQSLTISGGLATLGFSNPSGAGGINNSGTLTLTSDYVMHNSATDDSGISYMGAGILNEGSLTLQSTNVIANSGTGACTAAGGILNLRGGTLGVYHSYFTQNTITPPASACNEGPFIGPPGAAIYNQGTAVVHNTTILANKTDADYAALSNIGNLALLRTTISSNPENGIWNGAYGAVLELVNATVAKNTFGLVNQFYSSSGFPVGFVSIANSTISRNTQGGIDAGGVISSGGLSSSLNIANSILSDNSGTDCEGFMAGDYNLIGTSTCTVLSGGAHNLMGVSANLSPISYNKTMILAPSTDSAAIGAGNPTGCTDYLGNLITIDQRGVKRPDPSVVPCTLGAVEVQ